MGECILDNKGSESSVVVLNGARLTGHWLDVHIRGSDAGVGALIESGGSLDLRKYTILKTTDMVCLVSEGPPHAE
jgi:hypothetical protein